MLLRRAAPRCRLHRRVRPATIGRVEVDTVLGSVELALVGGQRQYLDRQALSPIVSAAFV
jgi:hypothetical protein